LIRNDTVKDTTGLDMLENTVGKKRLYIGLVMRNVSKQSKTSTALESWRKRGSTMHHLERHTLHGESFDAWS